MKKGIILMVMLFCSFFAFAEEGLCTDPEDFSYLEITLLNQDPDPANQGEYLDLRWKVVKLGNQRMDDITFNLDLDYPFYFDKSDTAEKKAGIWRGFSDDEEYYVLHYKVRVDEDALEDTYKVKIKAKHDTSGVVITKEFDIRVGEKTEPEFAIGNLDTSPVKLLSDTEENKIDVTVENIGDEDAQNVNVELELPDGFSATYGYSDRSNLGTVAFDSGETATFYVDIDEEVTQGEYEAKLIISYKEADDDDNEYKSVEIPLRIPLSGKPMFSIENVKTNPEVVVAGENVEMRVTVKNTGTKEAESVSLRVFKESSQPFEFEDKSDFIGKLKPGETGEAVLSFEVKDDADIKKYILDFEIRSVYNDEVLTESEVVSLDVKSSDNGLFGSGNSAVSVIIIGVILVGGLLLYFFVFKKKKD